MYIIIKYIYINYNLEFEIIINFFGYYYINNIKNIIKTQN